MVNLTPRSLTRRRDYSEPGMLGNFRSEMDRLFDRFISGPLSSMDPFGTSTWSPSLEVFDNENEVVVKAEVPGLDPEDIDVSIAGHELTISGEKKEQHEQTEDGYWFSERRYGSFRRTIELPREIESDKVSADYNNGVLTLRIPKSEAHRPKHIPIGSKSGSVAGGQRQQSSFRQGQPGSGVATGQSYESSQRASPTSGGQSNPARGGCGNGSGNVRPT